MLAPEKIQADRPLCLLIVAGEASGDAHGAELIHALKRAHPGVRVIGVGGPRMLAAGQEQLFDLAAHAVLGLTEVLKQYFKFRKFFHQVLDLAVREKPDAVILIDYPGFNLRLAKQLRTKLRGARTIFYISPQVWAWKAGRVKAMSRDIDLLLVILPFEKAWFAKTAPKFNVQWVGHPLLDRIQKADAPVPEYPSVALLPGSRRTEVTAHLPVLWEAARKMATQSPRIKFILLSPSEEMLDFSRKLLDTLPAANFEFETNIGYAVSHLSRCSLALVASGTASLECAIVGVPQIVVYKVHPLTFAVGRRLVKIRHLSMVNVLANEEIVSEFLQEKLQAGPLAEEALRLLDDPQRRAEMQKRIGAIVETLGGPGASERAARAILLEASFARVS